MKFSSLLRPEDQGLIKTVFKVAQKKKAELFIVGGYLRDILLSREKENPDIDFCLKKGAINFSRYLSKEIRGGFVVLDKEHGSSRVVKRIKDKSYTLDFTDFRGETLKDDLLHRDFTINTLSIRLEKVFSAAGLDELLIDPYQARKDIKSKIIRMVNKKAFDEDPLRILRAFSLSCIFAFRIEEETVKSIKSESRKLSGVSQERIRDEWFKILDTPNSYDCVVKMDKLKILKILFPEIEIMRGVRQGPYHHLDVWGHSLEALRQLEELIQKVKRDSDLGGYLNEKISGERGRRALIKLGVLLHDIGKPRALTHEEGKLKFHGHEKIGLDISEGIAQRLRLSHDELNALGKMVFWHLRPGYLADNEEITPRATFRYFRDTGSEAASILLISIADQRATKGPLTSEGSRRHHEKVTLGLVREYFRRKKEKITPRIINGDDLIKKFNLPPSPLIGKILREIEELQAIGKIKTKKEAFAVARTLQ